MLRLLLVRHARAGDRGIGPDDLARPLDARGVAQSEALPSLLLPVLRAPAPDGHQQEAERTIEVRSSPARRCIATVEPLSAELGVRVIVDEGLIEGADIRALHDRIGVLDGSAVWSSHGDVIPELLLMLARRGVDLGDDPRCRKGSTWVLDIEGGTVTAARYLPPPG